MKRACKAGLRQIIKALYWSPVLILVAIMGWSTIAIHRSLLPLMVFKWMVVGPIILFAVMIACYYKTIMTNPGSPREMVEEVEHGLNQEFISFQVKRNGRPRFCSKCNFLKPDRTHHCSSCSQCILKMDHHCPWMNNCLGFDNYKYFVQFLFYAFCYSLWILVIALNLVRGEAVMVITNFELLMLLIVSGAFSFSLMIFGGMHVYLLLNNLTTIEYMEGSGRVLVPRGGNDTDKHVYNLGWKGNLRSVFGESWQEWIFPIPTSQKVCGNGWAFQINSEALQRIEAFQNMH